MIVDEARGGELLFDVRHEDISFFGEQICIGRDCLRNDGEQIVVLLQSMRFDVHSKPTVRFAVQKANAVVIELVEG